MKKPKRIVHIRQRKLGRHNATGMFLEGKKSSLIEIDPRLSPKAELDTVIHESLHFAFPFIEEEAITKAATDIAEIMFSYGYRKEKK